MEQLIFTVIGALLTWAFYFIQRIAERRGTVDAIERGKQLLALKQELDGAHTSVEELRRFENRLIGKAEHAARVADSYVDKAEAIARDQGDEAVSQAEMNRQAMAELGREQARLNGVVAHLREQLDGDGRLAFERAHEAWQAFREQHARFVAQSYSSGSVRPLIYAVTMESITVAWINELETQLGEA
ncbi:lysozyme inhibitor LprI family protein [Lysobacter enzymogenes]|uniref:lysozyme inhibitor LprI family protein n=1 Tax=Lysobacter enzymogenes TaxID=69 RepID=UPI001A9752B8|nr:lysozyme inhibitor LprI family protein [Lysobacter enzymogenes]QQP94472.1 DUF1311 domain-containing protein [Lysobacter enzymogenes]